MKDISTIPAPPKTPKNQKKWATEVAQNALRALFIKTQSLPLLGESLQINNPSPAKQLSISMTVMTPPTTTWSGNMSAPSCRDPVRWVQINQRRIEKY
jgi:hypothetical protein